MPDTFEASSDDLGGLHDMTMPEGLKTLYFMGWIVYSDGRGEEFGDIRTTYFCREFNPTANMFRPSLEYTDWEFTH